MENKKSKFLFYMSCLLLLSAIGIFFGLHFQTQPVYAITDEAIISEASEQNADKFTANDIFENYTQTSLKDEFNTIEIITELHEQGKIDQKIFERANEVLKGNVKYSYQREFSTTFNDDHKIAQVGNLYTYSHTTLKFNFPTSEFNLTGIYGLTGQTIRVFVDADQDNNLPEIVFTQNHGYYTENQWQRQKTLHIGLNEFYYDDFVSSSSYISQSERKGGAIYIRNRHTNADQGDVSVYIEGGGYYPIFKKGDDEEEFLGALAEYYQEYQQSTTMLDMAELSTDHALFTTTASSLYNVYIRDQEISPTENLELWANYMNQVFEFNGIDDNEQNKHLVVNFRYMTTYKNSGAYTYFNHIGFYEEHYWFANFKNAKSSKYNFSDHLIFGIGHELGHMIDITGRYINETTNNFTGAFAYYKILGKKSQNSLNYEQYATFNKALGHIASDYTLDFQAYHDGKIMYTYDYVNGSGKTIKPDHNYLIWWDLECAFPGYWARLNNLYQSKELVDLSNLERMVYYSSIATKVDLSYYFERWGFYWSDETYTDFEHRFTFENSSKEFKELMSKAESEGEISKTNAPYWYADEYQFDFMQENKDVPENQRKYVGTKPTIKIEKDANVRTIYISGEKSENHLGYEVLSKTQDSDFQVAGFTYSSIFVDEHNYASTPTYKVVAINRFFNKGEESDECFLITPEEECVCTVADEQFFDLSEAIKVAEQKNETVYLFKSCSFSGCAISSDVVLQVADGVHNDIFINSERKSYLFNLNACLTLKGKEDANIIFDGTLVESSYTAIFCASKSGKLVAQNVKFQNMRGKGYTSPVISFTFGTIELKNCTIQNCLPANSGPAIMFKSPDQIKIENCNFSENFVDLNVVDLNSLSIYDQKSGFSLDFEAFTGQKTMKGQNISKEFLQEIKLNKDGYMLLLSEGDIVVRPMAFNLKFVSGGDIFEHSIQGTNFVFGTEQKFEITNRQYIEYTDQDGKKYFTGDQISLEKDMTFNIEMKEKIKLDIFFKTGKSTAYARQGEKYFLSNKDQSGQVVIAYKDRKSTYFAGQVIVVNDEIVLTAIYQGGFSYRYIVDNKIEDVGFGSYGEKVTLKKLEQAGFKGWQCEDEILSDFFILHNDVDLIAVVGDLPEIYDLEMCEIRIDGTYTYLGEAITPKIFVYFNGFIVPSECYGVSCTNNIDASTMAQVKITSIDGFSTGSKTEFFEIRPKTLNLQDVKVEGLKDFVYNGSQTEQTLTITYQNQAIDTFSVNYNGDRINAGDVQVEITFSGNYSGTIYLTYKISKAGRVNFKVVQANWTYGENSPNPRTEGHLETANVTYSYSTSLDGSYSFVKPTKAGIYWVKAVIDESLNYKSAEDIAQFTIEKAENPPKMPEKSMTISRNAKTLQDVNLNTEGWQWKTPSTKIVGESMTATAIYSDQENYKNYTILITLTKVPQKEISQLNVDLDVKNFVYNGTERTPNVVAKDGEKILNLNTDFEVKYQNNTNAGQASVVITGKNEYIGTMTLFFTIQRADLENFSVSLADWTYNDKIIPNPSTNGVKENAQVTYLYSNAINGVYNNIKPTDAGTYWVKATTTQTQNYNAAESKHKFTIHKATEPIVETILKINNQFEDLSEIELPANFEWVKNSLQVISETKMIAKAIYKGSDANNYLTNELTFEIIIGEQEQPNPPEKPENGSLIWLAIVVPAVALLVGWGIYAIIRRKRNNEQIEN